MRTQDALVQWFEYSTLETWPGCGQSVLRLAYLAVSQ